ncbi:MAG: orotidine-5'-phosphate decarboxylase [Anaerolineae bacterium]
MSRIVEKLNNRIEAVQSLVCVGLDSRLEALPEHFRDDPHPQFAFNRWIIEQTHPYTLAYKPNMAFYEARGADGLHDLALTMAYLREHHPDIVTICDAKRADIGSTNEGYVTAIFDTLGFDSVTLNPYLGGEALAPFLARADRGCIILCRTSNPGAGELQDLAVGDRPLWQIVAERVRDHWNAAGNCLLVTGATYPAELGIVRQIVDDMPLLVPGIGAQGGDLAATVQAGLDNHGRGMIINSSRGIIFADDPGTAAQTLRDAINAYRGV